MDAHALSEGPRVRRADAPTAIPSSSTRTLAARLQAAHFCPSTWPTRPRGRR